MSIPIRSILSRKGRGVTSVAPDEPLLSVTDTLVTNHIGAVTVIDENGNLLGLISERDIVAGLSEHHDEVMALTAADVMARQVRTCSRSASPRDAECVKFIYDHHRLRASQLKW